MLGELLGNAQQRVSTKVSRWRRDRILDVITMNCRLCRVCVFAIVIVLFALVVWLQFSGFYKVFK